MNYERYRPQSGGFQLLPEVVKNLLIINGIMYLATVVLGNTIDLVNKLGLHYYTSKDFQIYQLVTYMFMHGSMAHVFFNMFALWMFGSAVENVWGPKRFLTYYILTGLGAAVFHYGLVFFGITPNYDSVLVGASGAVMGLLLAYGMLFPNNLLYLYFLALIIFTCVCLK